jgi:hypothetical protein
MSMQDSAAVRKTSMIVCTRGLLRSSLGTPYSWFSKWVLVLSGTRSMQWCQDQKNTLEVTETFGQSRRWENIPFK